MQTQLLTARSAACLLALVTMTAGACADGAEPLSPSAVPAITSAVGGRPQSAPTRGLIAFSHGGISPGGGAVTHHGGQPLVIGAAAGVLQ